MGLTPWCVSQTLGIIRNMRSVTSIVTEKAFSLVWMPIPNIESTHTGAAWDISSSDWEGLWRLINVWKAWFNCWNQAVDPSLLFLSGCHCLAKDLYADLMPSRDASGWSPRQFNTDCTSMVLPTMCSHAWRGMVATAPPMGRDCRVTQNNSSNQGQQCKQTSSSGRH